VHQAGGAPQPALKIEEGSPRREATLDDRDSRLEDMRVILENCNDEVAAMEERVTHTHEERDRLQLCHNEAGMSLVTTQQELTEARSATTRAMEVDSDIARRAASEGPGD
jgi:hypothetical protein